MSKALVCPFCQALAPPVYSLRLTMDLTIKDLLVLKLPQFHFRVSVSVFHLSPLINGLFVQIGKEMTNLSDKNVHSQPSMVEGTSPLHQSIVQWMVFMRCFLHVKPFGHSYRSHETVNRDEVG